MTEIQNLLLRNTALKECAGIYAGRGVSLEINQVAGLIPIGGTKKMVESYFEQSGKRGISGDVTANSGVLLVLAMHHRHRIPANQRFKTTLHIPIAGIRKLLLYGNGVLVRRVELRRRLYAPFSCAAGKRC